MKKLLLSGITIILMIIIFNGCADESTDPPAFTNGLKITLAKEAGFQDYIARKNVSCNKDNINLVTFTASNDDDEEWVIKFQWDNIAEVGDTIFIADYNLNTITLTSNLVGDHYIEAWHGLANDTYIVVKQFTDGEILEAEVQGYIYEVGGSEIDTLKSGYLHTVNFD